MGHRGALFFAVVLSASCGVFSPSAGDLRDDPHGHLVWAARTGDVAAIRRLAARGVDVNASIETPIKFVFPDFDHVSWTALQHAVQKQQVESVRALLESGAKPDARQDGFPPLLIAAFQKDPAIWQLLIDAGADVNLSRKVLGEDEPGGPLWNALEHTMERVNGGTSRKEVFERLRTGGDQ